MIPLNGESEWKENLLSRVQLFATPWTVAHKASLSMDFSRQEDWIGLPFSSPGNLLNPGIELGSPTLQANSLPSEPLGKPDHLYIPDCINVSIHPILLIYPFSSPFPLGNC